MPTNQYMQVSDSEKKLLNDLNEEVRQIFRDVGYTDEQIDAMPKPKNKAKLKKAKK